ncbi:MAG: DsbE family thiol:disulfide interchange protein [Gammaproteobacteria bacterium]|nr:MAG: DsbE family thiol:disulfide interchange protein [Gammaproteobacteria bacterium]
MFTQKLKTTLPFIILIALSLLLWRELFSSTPNELPSALIGEPVPSFQLPTITPPNKTLTPQALLGHVSLLNVWATWCSACEVEHPMLMKITQQYHIPIYGIAYKDNADDVKNWLENSGNPYVMVGDDQNGDAAIDLGVYGTPETFVVNAQGKIVYRHIGAIDQKTWDNVLYPIIQQYEDVK